MNKNLLIKFSHRCPNIARVSAGHRVIKINRRFSKHYVHYRFAFLEPQGKGRAPLPFGSGDFRLPIKDGDKTLRYASKYIASALNSTNYQKYLKAVDNLVAKNRQLKATLRKAEAQLQAHGYQRPANDMTNDNIAKSMRKDVPRQGLFREINKH